MLQFYQMYSDRYFHIVEPLRNLRSFIVAFNLEFASVLPDLFDMIDDVLPLVVANAARKLVACSGHC